jgi:hypothetical protein
MSTFVYILKLQLLLFYFFLSSGMYACLTEEQLLVALMRWLIVILGAANYCIYIIHFFFSEYLFLEILFTLSSHPKKHKYFKHNYLPSHDQSFSDPTWCPMDNRLQMEFCLSFLFKNLFCVFISWQSIGISQAMIFILFFCNKIYVSFIYIYIYIYI